ncbi:MAG: imidazole glycerol phosphate synthase cyclase subunit [Alphaproteobacteria bacterium]|nr:imidazole glycerol phosphate synthase cyclase subunit [Alphaproteobacteria bacterium]
MLRTRLIACLVLRDGLIVQSVGFRRYLPIGKPRIAVEFLNRWGIDEIVLLDITATVQGRNPNTEAIAEAAGSCFVPMTVGGGIQDVADVEAVMRSGADKFCTNSRALREPAFITEAAAVYGQQSVVVSIDVRRRQDGGYEVVADGGNRRTGLDPAAWAREAVARGAGEVLLNSVDRDGSKLGYDLELVRLVSDAVDVPVIALGGVGRFRDLVDGVREGGATAVAAANIFHYTEHSVILAKAVMRDAGINVRVPAAARYEGRPFDQRGRLLAHWQDEAQGPAQDMAVASA